MVKVGDYVGLQGIYYPQLRGIVVEGPRIAPSTMQHTQYRVKWLESTVPEHWEPRPTGSWEVDRHLRVISSVET